jgi:hypothetical protein
VLTPPVSGAMSRHLAKSQRAASTTIGGRTYFAIGVSLIPVTFDLIYFFAGLTSYARMGRPSTGGIKTAAIPA